MSVRYPRMKLTEHVAQLGGGGVEIENGYARKVMLGNRSARKEAGSLYVVQHVVVTMEQLRRDLVCSFHHVFPINIRRYPPILVLVVIWSR